MISNQDVRTVIVLTIFIISSLVIAATDSENESSSSSSLRLLFFGDSIMHCSGVSKDFKSAYLSYRLPLMKKLLLSSSSSSSPSSTSSRHRHQSTLIPRFTTVGPHKGCNHKLDENINIFSQDLFQSEEYARSDSFFGRPLSEGVQDLGASLRKYKPDILIFSLGTNDIIKGSGGEKMLVHYEKAFQEMFKYRAELMTDKKKRSSNYSNPRHPFQVLFLSTVHLDVNRPKTVRRYRKANERLVAMNDAVHKRFFENKTDETKTGSSHFLFPLLKNSVLGYRRGTRSENDNSDANNQNWIYLLRVDEGFEPRTMTYDAIHPNEEGQNFLAAKIFPVLKFLMTTTVKKKNIVAEKKKEFSSSSSSAAFFPPPPSQIVNHREQLEYKAHLDSMVDINNHNSNRHHREDIEGDMQIHAMAAFTALIVVVIVVKNVLAKRKK